MPDSYAAPVILADGSPALIRSLLPADREQVVRLHESASDLSLYHRFFSLNRPEASRYAERVCTDGGDAWSLVAITRGRLVGLASAVRTGPELAEVAVMVDEHLRAVGVGTLLVEHLAVWCGRDDVKRFLADVLVDNLAMIRVFHDAGFVYVEEARNGVISLSLDVEQTPAFLAATAARQRRAEQRSIGRILEPASVAVVGVSARGHGIGRAVLDNVVGGGYAGAVHAVGRNLTGPWSAPSPLTRGRTVEIWRDVGDLPEGIDLAVVAVPGDELLDVVTTLAGRGTGACVVLTAGLGEGGPSGARLQQELAAVARDHGMRLVGPNCLGVVSNLRRTSLDATFASSHPGPGRLAIASQSGGVGIALLEAARNHGAGVACFVSTGNKADVSTNDLLMAWTDDAAVAAAAIYLESFKDPQRFARVASAFSARKPLLAAFGGWSESGRRAGSSHTAASATPGRALKALFNAAGVIEVADLADLVATARLLCEQPLPAGRRLGIVTNAGGIGILASDAAQAMGLLVPRLQAQTEGALRSLVAGIAGATNPVDLGAAAAAEAFAAATGAVITSVDALLVVVVATAITDIASVLTAVRAAVEERSGHDRKPVLGVVIGGEQTFDGDAGLTSFESVNAAVAALAHAVQYVDWRAERTLTPDPRLAVPLLAPGLASSGAENETCGSRWLPQDEVRALLVEGGIPVAAGQVVTSGAAAVATARVLGYPVAVKTAVPEIVHKTDQRLVFTTIPTAGGVRRAVRDIQAVAGSGTPVLVQHSTSGVEIAVGMVRDPRFGPLVMVATGGVSVDLWNDQVFLLPPMDATEVRAALSRLRTWPLLQGFRGSSAKNVDALVDLVLGVGALAVHVPEVCEIDLNPVMVTEHGVSAVDAKVRIAEADAEPGAVPDEEARGRGPRARAAESHDRGGDALRHL